MDASGANHNPKPRRDACVKKDALSHCTDDKLEIKPFLLNLVKNKSSLIVCKEALAALLITIRDIMGPYIQ